MTKKRRRITREEQNLIDILKKPANRIVRRQQRPGRPQESGRPQPSRRPK